jgi:hypothetical protein
MNEIKNTHPLEHDLRHQKLLTDIKNTDELMEFYTKNVS